LKLEDEEGMIGGIESFIVPLRHVLMEFLELVSGSHIVNQDSNSKSTLSLEAL